MFTSLYFFVTGLAALFPIVKSTPVTFDKRIVWSPPILIPNASTVWEIGSTVNVTWNTTGAPDSITEGSFIDLNTPSGPFGQCIIVVASMQVLLLHQVNPLRKALT